NVGCGLPDDSALHDGGIASLRRFDLESGHESFYHGQLLVEFVIGLRHPGSRGFHAWRLPSHHCCANCSRLLVSQYKAFRTPRGADGRLSVSAMHKSVHGAAPAMLLVTDESGFS